MAWSRVQPVVRVNVTSGATVNVTVAATTVGNLGILLLNEIGSRTITGVSGGGTWAQDANGTDTTICCTALSTIFTSSVTTITITPSSSGVLQGWFLEYSGNKASSPFDQAGSTLGNGIGTTFASNGASGALAQVGDLAVGLVEDNTGSSTLSVTASEWTQVETFLSADGDQMTLGVIEGVTSTTLQTFSGTCSGSHRCTAIMAAYSPGGAAAAFVPATMRTVQQAVNRASTY